MDSRFYEQGFRFTFLVGDEPPALSIDRVLRPGVGEPQFVCRKKSRAGDPTPAAFQIVDYIIGPQGFALIGVLVLVFYFRESLGEAIAQGLGGAAERVAEAKARHAEARYVADSEKGQKGNADGDGGGVLVFFLRDYTLS